MAKGAWIGVDLDGTLARYEGWVDEMHIGEPVPLMLERVIRWIANGKRVKIVTARVAPIQSDGSIRNTHIVREFIHEWCRAHIGVVLEVTHEKDFLMIELWDDRCVQVELNTGRRVDGKD